MLPLQWVKTCPAVSGAKLIVEVWPAVTVTLPSQWQTTRFAAGPELASKPTETSALYEPGLTVKFSAPPGAMTLPAWGAPFKRNPRADTCALSTMRTVPVRIIVKSGETDTVCREHGETQKLVLTQ